MKLFHENFVKFHKFTNLRIYESLCTNEPSVAEHRSRTRKLAAACRSSSSSQKVNHIGHCQMAVAELERTNGQHRRTTELLLDFAAISGWRNPAKNKEKNSTRANERLGHCIYFGTKSHMSSEIWGTAPVMCRSMQKYYY